MWWFCVLLALPWSFATNSCDDLQHELSTFTRWSRFDIRPGVHMIEIVGDVVVDTNVNLPNVGVHVAETGRLWFVPLDWLNSNPQLASSSDPSALSQLVRPPNLALSRQFVPLEQHLVLSALPLRSAQTIIGATSAASVVRMDWLTGWVVINGEWRMGADQCPLRDQWKLRLSPPLSAPLAQPLSAEGVSLLYPRAHPRPQRPVQPVNRPVVTKPKEVLPVWLQPQQHFRVAPLMDSGSPVLEKDTKPLDVPRPVLAPNQQETDLSWLNSQRRPGDLGHPVLDVSQPQVAPNQKETDSSWLNRVHPISKPAPLASGYNQQQASPTTAQPASILDLPKSSLDPNQKESDPSWINQVHPVRGSDSASSIQLTRGSVVDPSAPILDVPRPTLAPNQQETDPSWIKHPIQPTSKASQHEQKDTQLHQTFPTNFPSSLTYFVSQLSQEIGLDLRHIKPTWERFVEQDQKLKQIIQEWKLLEVVKSVLKDWFGFADSDFADILSEAEKSIGEAPERAPLLDIQPLKSLIESNPFDIIVEGQDFGERAFGVGVNGVLELHGAKGLAASWTRLVSTATVGTKSLLVHADMTFTLAPPSPPPIAPLSSTGSAVHNLPTTLALPALAWAVGDEIVISSTDFNAFQAETRSISAIRPRRLAIPHHMIQQANRLAATSPAPSLGFSASSSISNPSTLFHPAPNLTPPPSTSYSSRLYSSLFPAPICPSTCAKSARCCSIHYHLTRLIWETDITSPPPASVAPIVMFFPYLHPSTGQPENEEAGEWVQLVTELELDKPLKYEHHGEVVEGVDMRAEVGLLSRSIIIGDDSVPNFSTGSLKNNNNEGSYEDYAGFGVHTMFHHGARALRIEGVEFRRMGQNTRIAKYPVHFHMMGQSPPNTYFHGNSIHRSNFRCITIHGTHGIRVSWNVAYDHYGHCIFLEDGSEQNNHFDFNLALVTRMKKVQPPNNGRGYVGIRSDQEAPSTYWMTHPQNDMTNNVAGGSQDTGIWHLFRMNVAGLSRMSGEYDPPYYGGRPGSLLSPRSPRSTPMGLFDGNVVHSNRVRGYMLEPTNHSPDLDNNGIPRPMQSPFDNYYPKMSSSAPTTLSSALWTNSPTTTSSNSPVWSYYPALSAQSSLAPNWKARVWDGVLDGSKEVDAETVITRLTVYKNVDKGAWSRGGDFVYDRCAFGDNRSGLTIATSGTHPDLPGARGLASNCMFVGLSLTNKGNWDRALDSQFTSLGIGFVGEKHPDYGITTPGGPSIPMRGIQLYDGPMEVVNSTFVHFHNSDRFGGKQDIFPSHAALAFFWYNTWQMASTNAVKNARFTPSYAGLPSTSASSSSTLRNIISGLKNLIPGTTTTPPSLTVDNNPDDSSIRPFAPLPLESEKLHSHFQLHAPFYHTNNRVWFSHDQITEATNGLLLVNKQTRLDGDSNSLILDADGSVTGFVNASIINGYPFFTTPSCLNAPNHLRPQSTQSANRPSFTPELQYYQRWGSCAVCPYKYANLWVVNENTGRTDYRRTLPQLAANSPMRDRDVDGGRYDDDVDIHNSQLPPSSPLSPSFSSSSPRRENWYDRPNALNEEQVFPMGYQQDTKAKDLFETGLYIVRDQFSDPSLSPRLVAHRLQGPTAFNTQGHKFRFQSLLIVGPAMPDDSSVGLPTVFASYTLHFPHPTPPNLRLQLNNIEQNDAVRFGVCYPPGTTNFRMYRGLYANNFINPGSKGSPPTRQLPEVDSLTSPQFLSGDAFVWDPEARVLFFMMVQRFKRSGYHYCPAGPGEGCEQVWIDADIPPHANRIPHAGDCFMSAYPKYQETDFRLRSISL